MKKCFIILLVALCVLGIVACKHEPKHEHTWDEGKIITPATCTAEGVKVYTCTDCGEAKAEVLEATGHTYESVISTPATCTENGIMTTTCTKCGYSFQTQIDRLGHDLTEYAEVAATCTTDGTKAHRHCSRCDKNYDVNGNMIEDIIIIATGHTWDSGTPDGEGNIVYECQVCHDTKTVPIPIYSVGDIGPAGGYIFYDCDADNMSGNEDGLISTECGWRFLEAAPGDLRVVNDVPTVDSSFDGYSDAAIGYMIGYYKNSDIGKLLFVNGTTTYDSSNCTGTGIGTGESNTQLLIDAMGTEAYTSPSGSEKDSNYAARLCDILTYTVEGVTFDDWFLPSKDELNLMCEKQTEIGGFGDTVPCYYWTSSEYNTQAGDIWEQNFASGYQRNYSRYETSRVRPIRSFI